MAEESELMRSLQLLPLDTVNPFNLPEAERQVCGICRYRNGHSTLVLRATLDNLIEKSKYIWFSSIEYFCGPMVWVGANFRPMNRDDVIRLMWPMGEFSNPKYADVLPMGIGGIELTTGGTVVRILARSFGVTNSFDPSTF
jgi:hypothetical protein